MPKEKTQIETKENVVIGGVNIQRFNLTLVGTAPLISHKFSEKAIGKIEDKQQKKATKRVGREVRNPESDFKESLYILEDGRYGFPLSAFKNAAVDACTFVDTQKKTKARGAFHLIDQNGSGLTVIEGTPHMRKDMVRVGMGSADVRYRGEFPIGWKTTLSIQYNANAMSVDEIVQLFNTAGFGVGVGDWRPQKDGSYGMFKVESV